MSARDELAKLLFQQNVSNAAAPTAPEIIMLCEDAADAILAAGYRRIFDGDCGLRGIDDPASREAAEAWMRWANLLNTGFGEPNGIAAMKQMLSEFGYTRPRTITTAEELDALPIGSVVLSEAYLHHVDHWKVSFQRWDDGSWHRGGRSADTHPDNFLPATVIYSPEASA
jgi:hypothetical protein